jgi:hypothetical protein
MGLHIGQVGQPRHCKTRHAWVVIFTKTRLVFSHGAVGCSDWVGFGALLVGATISNSAFMKIRGSQNNIGIVATSSIPAVHYDPASMAVNIPLDIGNLSLLIFEEVGPQEGRAKDHLLIPGA